MAAQAETYFDFSSETAERNSAKLDSKQDLNVLYQVCVFQAEKWIKIVTLANPSKKVAHFQNFPQPRRLKQQTECITVILKHVGWSVVVFGSIPKSNFWSVDCTQVSDSGPLGLLFGPQLGYKKNVNVLFAGLSSFNTKNVDAIFV